MLNNYKDRVNIKICKKYSYLISDKDSAYYINQNHNVNELINVYIKNQDLILSNNIPRIIKIIKENNVYFKNINLTYEDVILVMCTLGWLCGSISLRDAGTILSLVSIGILIIKGEALNNIYNLILSSCIILTNENIINNLSDKNKLGRMQKAINF